VQGVGIPLPAVQEILLSYASTQSASLGRALALTSCRVVVLGRFASGDDFRLETGSLWTRQNDHTSHSQAYVFLAVGYIWDPM
jgi:hypothetical protein